MHQDNYIQIIIQIIAAVALTALIAALLPSSGAKRPAKSVQVFVNGSNAGSVVPRIDRPDVTKAFGITSSRTFGFRAIVPGNAADTVRVFAEDSDGSFFELHPPVK
jgi:hypothetical protein